MPTIELGKRLKEAREMAGLTLGEAAERLGFPSYQTLSKIEKGEREVKASELPLFSKAYFCNVSTLLAEKELRSVPSLLWRRAPEGKQKNFIEARIFNLCEKYHLLETLLGLKDEEEFRFLDIGLDDIRTNGDIDNLAYKAISVLELGSRPAFTLQKVLEQKFAVKILFCSLSDSGSAASIIHPDFGAVIVINSDEAPWRRNYDLAHELFHLITWKIVSHEDLNEASFREIEKKAERFASTLLLPEKEVQREISNKLKRQEGKISYSDLVDIAREFGVSTIALLYRLTNLRFLTWEKSSELARNEDLLGLDRSIRKKDWGMPSQERFYFLAIQCLRKGLISKGKFTEIVEIERREVDDFISNFGLMEVEGAPVEIMAT